MNPLFKDIPTYGKWITYLLDAVTTPAYATNCWSGGNNWGYRNNAVKTDSNGSSKACEAKFHVCYSGGAGDAAIPCTVNTTGLCDNACDNMQTPNQIACSYADCQSRCYHARVSGYNDTCN